jgi:hypothetical protein
MDIAKQLSVALQAEAARKGATTATCAGLYAVAIGFRSGAESDYWTPINDVLIGTFGLKGLVLVKETAWKIHDNAAAALKAEKF